MGNFDPRKYRGGQRASFRAQERRHARQDGWCVHCGREVTPCTCSSCHRGAMIGRQRKRVVVAVYYGQDVERDHRWMHEPCVGQRLAMAEASRDLPFFAPPAPERPACVIDLSTRVEPARIIELPPLVVSPAMLKAQGPFRSM